MAGYIKWIALIKTISSGYSADGGALKGIVRCEAYAGFLKCEASLINFAPVTEGCFRLGISDGARIIVFDPPAYEGECPFLLSGGFACLIAYCRAGEVVPVACAVCGDLRDCLPDIRAAIERAEGAPESDYDDEAIADENYYELQTSENSGAVRQGQTQKEGAQPFKDEDTSRVGEVARGGKATMPQFDAVESGDAAQQHGKNSPDDGYARGKGAIKLSSSRFRVGGSPEEEQSENVDTPSDMPQTTRSAANNEGAYAECAYAAGGEEDARPAEPRLAEGGFYERMSGDIKNIFAAYPRAEQLEEAVEGSRWAKISYGNGEHYAFGVIYSGGKAAYLCYGVPVAAGSACPESLAGRASYIPVSGGGYWVMYQDATTGVSITVNNA